VQGERIGVVGLHGGGKTSLLEVLTGIEEPAWRAAGDQAPDHEIAVGNPLTIDLDATLLDSHSEKECAAPTYKMGFGLHPLLVFCDHGPDGTGEPVAELLRRGKCRRQYRCGPHEGPRGRVTPKSSCATPDQ
jgi:energy-coupling factor transporter ATP-binding protein EcfA2